jgi:hypothetical protein
MGQSHRLAPHHENRDMTEPAPVGPNLAYQSHFDGALAVTNTERKNLL